MTSLRRRAALLGLCITALAASPASANTTPLGSTVIVSTSASASTCQAALFSKPFAAIGDTRNYVLAPAGSFTGAVAPGWQLAGGARLAADSTRGTSLVLPAGASAITPAFCVDLNYPHARVAHRFTGSNTAGVELGVEVVYPRVSQPFWNQVKQFDGFQGNLVAGGWRISPDIDLKPDLGGSTPGARYAALRFTAIKKSSTAAEIRLDDLWIDPYRRG